jgi:hypothetical protein
LYLYFFIVAVGRLWEQGQQCQSLLEVRDGFGMARASGRLFAGLQPPLDGAPRFASGRQVAGEQLRLAHS